MKQGRCVKHKGCRERARESLCLKNVYVEIMTSRSPEKGSATSIVASRNSLGYGPEEGVGENE